MSVRKRAGASNLNGRGGSGAGMTKLMKERIKEALSGCTGETDDEDE